MVNLGNGKGSMDYFDLAQIIRKGLVDSSIRESVMNAFPSALKLIAPGDIISLGIGLSSTPGVDMSGTSGDVLAKLQEQNVKQNEDNAHLGNVCSELQAEGKESRKQYKTLEAEFRDYKQANPPNTP